MKEFPVTIYVLIVQPHSFGAEAMGERARSMKCCTVLANFSVTFHAPGVCPHSFGTEAMRRADSSMDCYKNLTQVSLLLTTEFPHNQDALKSGLIDDHTLGAFHLAPNL